MSQFEQLMGELNQLSTDQADLAKALPADDGKDEKKIQAAAAEGGLEGGGAGDGAAENNDGKLGEDGKPLVKSFQLTLEDGTVVEAQDGAEMVKALSDRVEKNESDMAKALGVAVSLIKGQGELIKSLGARLEKLSGEGRGRKAVVSIVEKPVPGAELVKSITQQQQENGLTTDQFFAKAMAAQREGRISGTDIALAETYLNRGQPIPADIVQRVTQ